jgi:hypothetical protein
MMTFLQSTIGKWSVRLAGLAVTWLILTLGAGLDWHGGGHAFLIVLFAIMLLCGAYAFEQAVALVLDIAKMRQKPSTARLQWQGPIPQLSKAKQAQVRRLHKVMAQAGVFAPEVPDPVMAFAAFAADKQPVDWVGVLQSLAEAPYYHPELDEADWEASWSANLLSDHVPQAWLDPPPGKVAAVLWEDENIYLSLVKSSHLAALGEEFVRGKFASSGWQPVTADLLGPLAEAGVSVR